MKNPDYILMLEPVAQGKEACRESLNSKQIHTEFLNHSNEVMSFLTARLLSGQALPRVILLNMNSAPQNGAFVLEEIKEDDNFRHIPVVMICESADDATVKRCYDLGANSVVNELYSSSEMSSKMDACLSYWLEVAESAAKSSVAYS